MYRPNVGICLIDSLGKIFAGKRHHLKPNRNFDNDSLWQMPQEGVRNLDNESELLEDMYKELWEEVGLYPHHVKILGFSKKLKYEFSESVLEHLKNTDYAPFIGQEQIWFYLEFLGKDSDIKLDNEKNPEFSEWRWMKKEFLLKNVVEMKKSIYKVILLGNIGINAL